MPERVWHNKKDTIARVEREYRALERTVKLLGAKGLDEPVPGFGARARIRRERWLRRDALAHIVEWKRNQLRAMKKEPADPSLKGLEFHLQNRRLYLRWHRKTSGEVIAFHRAVGKEIRAAMRALPQEYFKKRFSPIWPNDLVGHARWHREHHLEV